MMLMLHNGKTREMLVEEMVNQDVEDIRREVFSENGDMTFLYAVLEGCGWKPYNQLSDEEIVSEYKYRGLEED